jgi:hypothetical protein
MRPLLAVAVSALFGCVAFAGVHPAVIEQAADFVGQQAALTPVAQDLEFRLLAAQALQTRYPDLSWKLVGKVLDQLRANKEIITTNLKGPLTSLAPAEAKTLFPPPTASSVPELVSASRPPQPPELAAINKGLREIRGLPTDLSRQRRG